MRMGMTVAELIEFLKEQPQDLLVIYRCFSEHCLLEKEDIKILEGCKPRLDGWVPNARPDKPEYKYLCFPGN